MSVTHSGRDLEQGNPEEEDHSEDYDHLMPLLSAGFSGYQPRATRNPEEFHLKPLDANHSQPTSSTSSNERDPELNETRDLMWKLIEKGAGLALSKDDGEQTLLLEELKVRDRLETLVKKIGPDVKDRDGKTVLRAAVDADWLPGVCVALAARADVTIQAIDGETPLHAAVAGITNHNEELRKTMILEILSVTEPADAVNCPNAIKETPLFYAVRNGHIWCVQQFLEKGASITHTGECNLNVFHIAAQHSHKDILEKLLNFDQETTKMMINSLTPTYRGCAPIHFAVSNNNVCCVKLLKNKNANVCIRTINYSYGWQTPLHMAIDNGNYDIAEYFLSSDHTQSTLENSQRSPNEQVNGKGWLPLHFAIHKGNENFIKLLLKYGASLTSLTQTETPKTALDMIVQHVTNPKDFLEGVLDSCVSLDGSPDKVIIDYKILMPNTTLNMEMGVIEALINTGNEFDQKNLLLHPLIESFIYQKWWALMPYYLMIAAFNLIYFIVFASFNIYVFDEIDNNPKPEESILFRWYGLIQLLLHVVMILETHRTIASGRKFYKKLENIIKLGYFILAHISPLMTMRQGWEDAARYLATAALLLASIQMLNILSQCPPLGYYVLIFNKVTWNFLKILTTFAILIIGFALSFKILFRSQIPFDSTWHAIVKTLFLLTSEFNYDDLFKSENTTNLQTPSTATPSPYEGTRFIFVIFLILIAIVLMNVMTGVAVDDINDLKTKGKSGRLEQQASFVRSLDNLKYKVLTELLKKSGRSQFPEKISLEKKTAKRDMPKHFKDAFFSIAQNNFIKQNELKERNKIEKQYIFHDKTTERLDKMEVTITKNALQIHNINDKLNVVIKQSSDIMQFLINLTINKDKDAHKLRRTHSV